MELNEGRHIATAQTPIGEVFSQSYAGVEVVSYNLSRNRGTNLVVSVASSFVQMVTMLNQSQFSPMSVSRMR